MSLTRRKLFLPALLLLAAFLPAQENLELGKMWTFENINLEYLEAIYGFSPSQEWLDTTRLASLRMTSGCSASFVSPEGLILTNHHCVRDAVAQISPAGQDWVKNGFVAGSREEEVPLPDNVRMEQLIAISDVTDRMNSGIGEDDDVQAVAAKREENEETILEEARRQHPGMKVQVVSLYHGGRFHLYVYRVFEDIRLAAAPHLQTAHFGGDPDNFTYPRYGIDFALLRAYEDGKPVDSSGHHFTWSDDGAAEGELVFVTGNPGSTGRLNTVAQLEYLRDVEYPMNLGFIHGQLELFNNVLEETPALEERLRTRILSLENSDKAITGYLSGLQDEELMARKAEAQKQFRARIAEDPAMQEEYGSAWKRLKEIAREKRELTPKLRFHDPGYSPLLQRARWVVRATDPEATEEERQEAATRARSMPRTNPINRRWQLKRLKLAVRFLPEDDPYLKALLRGEAPEEALETLASESRMDDGDYVEELLEGGREAVTASEDPAVAAALIVDPLMEEHAERNTELKTAEKVELARIGQAVYAVYGSKVSPDATFTLRISDGVVRGFPMNGTIAPPATSFYGLYARNCEFNNEHPFDLPRIWKDREDRIEMTTRLDFVSTNDIIGGNSGSPVINKDQEIVGVVFDGNIQMLPNRFLYTDEEARTVSVHSEAILEALRKIYDAGPLADELEGL